MWTHFEGLSTKLLLTTVYDFLTRHLKNVKSRDFLKSENSVKYLFSNIAFVWYAASCANYKPSYYANAMTLILQINLHK